MAFLSRKDLLKRDDFKIEKVDLGQGNFVYVRQMSGREKDRFEQSVMKAVRTENGELVRMEQNLEDFRAKLAVCTLCDENGDLLLKPEDYTLLSQNMSAAKLEKIMSVAQSINRITEQDKEELVKNSETGPVEDSHSGSVKR